MGLVRQQALERAFKMLAKKGEVLFRKEDLPDQLIEKGFNTEMQNNRMDLAGFTGLDWGEPNGLYMAKDRVALGPLIKGKATPWQPKPNVAAVPLPGTRQRSFSPEEWERDYMPLAGHEVTSKLKKDYDFVTFPDLTADQPNLTQTVQLNPKKAVAKIRDSSGKINYKLLGTAGALGLGGSAMGMFTPDEAEAMPIGKAFKLGSKALGSVSSASDSVKGATAFGKVVKEVRRGNGDWRDLIFEDGTGLAVTKDYVHSLARQVGTERYINRFDTRAAEEQVIQAKKSLRMHEAMAGYRPSTNWDKISTRTYHRQYLGQAKELNDQKVPDSVMVSYNQKYFSMPRKYAELLESRGELVIVRGKKEQQMLNKYSPK